MNNAQCTEGSGAQIGNYVCQCQPGYTGADCGKGNCLGFLI